MYNRDGANPFSDRANALAVKGNRVFVVGGTTTVAGGTAFAVRAYSAKDGALLWEDHFDRSGTGWDEATAVAVQGNAVFVAGRTAPSGGGSAFTVRAYSATSGSLLWEDHFQGSVSLDNWANGIAVKGQTVVAVGRTYTALGGVAFTVRAYSAVDGSLIWAEQLDWDEDESDEAYGVAFQGNTVFAAGRTFSAAEGGAFTVRAYSAHDGSLLWQENHRRPGGLGGYASELAANKNSLFAAGATTTPSGGSALTVRAYRTRKGTAVTWEEHYDRELDGSDEARAIAVSGNRVFVAGTTETAEGYRAFTVRAYSAEP